MTLSVRVLPVAFLPTTRLIGPRERPSRVHSLGWPRRSKYLTDISRTGILNSILVELAWARDSRSYSSSLISGRTIAKWPLWPATSWIGVVCGTLSAILANGLPGLRHRLFPGPGQRRLAQLARASRQR